MVLRQFERATPNHVNLVNHEAAVLRDAHDCQLAAPELLASSADGADTGGHPSILMTRLPGHIYLMPEDRDDWLRQIAELAVQIHNAKVTAPPFRSWFDPADLTVPRSASRPDLWRTLFAVLQQQRDVAYPCFVHRDFQHFNFLWRRGRLTGAVDWGMAASGPPDLDVGHCRLNLTVLFGADLAERFRLAYQAEAGRSVDPWWDLHSIAVYGDAWRGFIPIQVAGGAPVDTAGMTARVEDLLAATLRRL
jgi:aminoglycoside phosphotransferase (APT) family kinase protein